MKKFLVFAIISLFIATLAGLFVWVTKFFYPKQYVKNEAGEYVNVEAASVKDTFPVTKTTSFQIEHYYSDSGKHLTEDVKDIPALLGCDKEAVTEYLSEYMKHLSHEEQEEGLISFEMVSYKDNLICLRKTYHKKAVTGYIAKSFNGTIVILNGDEKTVYEFTKIPIHILPETLQEEMMKGYHLEDDEALYNFLETYSS